MGKENLSSLSQLPGLLIKFYFVSFILLALFLVNLVGVYMRKGWEGGEGVGEGMRHS